MAKKFNWEIPDEEAVHSVSLVCSHISGKAIVTIDGTEFDISTHPFGLRGTQQVFRLGESAAILDFPKKGDPDIVIDGTYVGSGKPYGA